jgi:hypothetical protein
MVKFEYKVVGSPSEEELNELGAQGWELSSTDGHRFILKRPKPEVIATGPAKEVFVPKKK